MVIVRFETLNPLTPDPDFDNLFCVFLQAIGEFQLLVSMIPASYWGIRACKVFFAGKLLGRSHLEGPVVATSHWEIHICEIWLLGNSILEGFESVSLPLL